MVFVQAVLGDELVAELGLAAPTALAGPAPAVYPVIDRVAAKISTLDTPPDVMAVFPLPEKQPLGALRGPSTSPKGAALRRQAGGELPASDPLVVYIDGVQDPGNVGTLLRAALAFDAAAVVTGPGSADLYGPKTVRASMGALFGLQLAADVPLGELVHALDEPDVFGLAAHDGAPLRGAKLRRTAVLVVGA